MAGPWAALRGLAGPRHELGRLHAQHLCRRGQPVVWAGGLGLHSIVVDPDNPQRLWVAISAVGTFHSEDGGKTWQTRNRGVRVGFMPDEFPEFGQCVHKLVKAAGERDLLLQQNHCGVYRSRDAGATWQEITKGLPSEFGFPMVAHPRESATVWVIPLNG